MDPSAPESSKPAAGRFLPRTFRAFRYRDFRVLWLGAFTSTTGSLMQQTAQSWLIFQLTGRAFYLGLTSFLAQLPLVLFSVLSGALADRMDRRKLLLFSQGVQMTTAFILTALIFLDWIKIWHFLVLVFVTGLGQAFGGPAYQALIPGLVKRQDVPNAIALNSIQFNLARVVGPMLAAVVMTTLGAVFCFALNGLSFLAVILSLLLIQSTFRPHKTEATFASQIKEGIRFVVGKRSLRQLMILGFVSTFCGVPLLTLVPAFVKDVYLMGDLMGAVTYSWMLSIAGAGAVVGALLYAGLSGLSRRGLLTLWSQLALAVLTAAFAFSSHWMVASVFLFGAGTCLIGLFASITSLVQLATPDEMRGRVMSLFVLAFRGGMPAGDLTAGVLADSFSPPAAILFLAILLGCVSSAFLLFGDRVKQL